MRSNHTIWLGVLLGIVVSACDDGESDQAAVSANAPVRVATVSVVESRSADVGFQAVGTVGAIAQATPSTRVSGRITAMAADRGDRVTTGQLLVRVDSQDLQQGLEKARAMRAQHNATLQMAVADFNRAGSLFAEDAISQQAMDRARTARAQAVAAVTIADRAVDEAQAHLPYCEVRAPFDGVVTDRFVEVGDLAVPGHPLVTLERTDSMTVTIAVSETDADLIRPGSDANIEVGARMWLGKVQSIVPASVRQTRTYDVRIVVDNADGQLRSGRFARAGFRVGERPALFVERDFVVRQGQLRGVYVLTEGRALLRWLRLGDQPYGDIEVVSGLRAGETLVAPAAGIHDGVAIAIAREQ
ncbi:MAG: efflux RND transporter periplasmic adaptor subunit [Gemmatimonadetes bacterium]|nr:efflux RND transporter periplasmic adaptor subunit [Gemmatimonadota bacterium]